MSSTTIFKVKHNGQKIRVRVMSDDEIIDDKTLCFRKPDFNHLSNFSEPEPLDFKRFVDSAVLKLSEMQGERVGDMPNWFYVHVESAFFKL